MLDSYTVAFFGHKYIENPLMVEQLIEEQILTLINTKEYVEFLVGRNGEFDLCATSAILSIRKEHNDYNNSLSLILPYDNAEYRNNKEYFEKYYSSVEISYKAELAHPKRAIEIRNREMVDRADLVICYVEREEGGAFRAVKYAMKKEKKIINLAQLL